MAKQAKAQKVDLEEISKKTATPVQPTKPEWEIKPRTYI